MPESAFYVLIAAAIIKSVKSPDYPAEKAVEEALALWDEVYKRMKS